LLLAGVNPVAVDVIAGEILGIPKSLLYIESAARKMGIQGADRRTITTLGCSLEEAGVSDFLLPHVSSVQWGLPLFLMRSLRNHLTAYPYPVPDKCVLCGICRDACPPGAMEIRDGKLHIDYRRCIRCFCCRELCPENALRIREGLLQRIIEKYI
jgi:ferredoxin